MPCPHEDEIARFAARALPPAAAALIEAHVADCDDCRNLVFALATDGAPASEAEDPTVGRAGRFVGLEPIGRGAMGVVYRARDPELDRFVAIKLRRGRSRLAVDGEDRLRREAQALARLTDPNVVVVYETGRHGDSIYIAMEYVDGVTLDEWLATRPSMNAVIDVLASAGRGLAAAHAVGLVHRDFKPRNVFITRDGVAKVGDFGLARLDVSDAQPPGAAVGDLAVTLSITGAILGTPAYMAPEQLRGEVATSASDQFSFCVTLHEALYGVRPFTGSSIEQMREHMRRGATLPSTPRVPARVRRVLARGLALEPQHRFPSMTGLLGQLTKRRSAALRFMTVGVAASAITLAAVLASGAASSPPAPCSGRSAELDETWSPARRLKLQADLLASRLYAGHTVEAIIGAVDADAAGAVELRAKACQATRRGAQSPAVFDRQVACLEDHAAALRTRLDLLMRDDKSSLPHARELVAGLPRIADCEAQSALLGLPSLPGDPKTRAELAAVRAEVARAAALRDAGHATDALAVLRPLRGLGYAPVEASIAYELGTTHSDLGHPREADQLLGAAVAYGLGGGTHDLLAQALAYRAAVRESSFGDRERSTEYLTQALALVDRLPASGYAVPRVHALAGHVYRLRKDYANATASIERSLAKLGDDDTVYGRVNRAALREGLAQIHIDRGEPELAYDVLRAIYEDTRRELGSRHPTVGRIASNLMVVCDRLGRSAESDCYRADAIQAFGGSASLDAQRVAAIMYLTKPAAEQAPAELRQHGMTLVVHSGSLPNRDDQIGSLVMGAVLLLKGDDLASSRQAAERALALAGHDDANLLDVALTVVGLAELLDGKLADARRHLDRGIAIARAAPDPDPTGLAHLLWFSAVEHARSKRFDRARAHLEEASRLAAEEPTEDTQELDEILPFWVAWVRYRAGLPGATREAALELRDRLTLDPDVSALSKELMSGER